MTDQGLLESIVTAGVGEASGEIIESIYIRIYLDRSYG